MGMVRAQTLEESFLEQEERMRQIEMLNQLPLAIPPQMEEEKMEDLNIRNLATPSRIDWDAIAEILVSFQQGLFSSQNSSAPQVTIQDENAQKKSNFTL